MGSMQVSGFAATSSLALNFDSVLEGRLGGNGANYGS